MSKFVKLWLPLLVGIALLSGCATTRPLAYQGLASKPELARNPQDKSGHLPFMYSAPNIDWSKYHSVILDPVTIYLGPDQQFGKLSGADQARLANDAQNKFASELKTKYTLVSSPGPGLSGISCLRHNMLPRRMHASQTENPAGGPAGDSRRAA